jgi:hypothetical protein
MTRRSHHKEDAMSARKWAITLPIAHNCRTRKSRRGGTRRNIKVMLILVKNGSLVMKTLIMKVWQL